MNFATNHMGPSSLQPSDETPAWADTLIVTLGETLKQRTQLSSAQIPDPQKLWDNKCGSFSAAMFWSNSLCSNR